MATPGDVWSTGFISANNISIHYWQHGAYNDFNSSSSSASVALAALPLLVFLHGFTGCGGSIIDPVTPFLTNYSVVLPDTRGHGQSKPIPEGSFTMANMVADVAAVIRYFSPTSSVLLAGHSMGAAIAAHVARYHPDLVTAVVLQEPPWDRLPGVPYSQANYLNETTQRLDPNMMLELALSLQNMTDEDFAAVDSASGLSATATSAQSEDQLQCMRQFDTADVDAQAMVSVDVRNTEGMPGIVVPVFLQRGDPATASELNGSKLDPGVAEAMVATYPQGRLEVFAGGYHALMGPPTQQLWTEETLNYLAQFV